MNSNTRRAEKKTEHAFAAPTIPSLPALQPARRPPHAPPANEPGGAGWVGRAAAEQSVLLPVHWRFVSADVLEVNSFLYNLYVLPRRHALTFKQTQVELILFFPPQRVLRRWIITKPQHQRQTDRNSDILES